jgi:hypothetical protein
MIIKDKNIENTFLGKIVLAKISMTHGGRSSAADVLKALNAEK